MEMAALRLVLKDALDSVSSPPGVAGASVSAFVTDDEFIEALESRFLVMSHALEAREVN